jgi:hypothetical protein
MEKRKKKGPDFLCIGMKKAATRWLFDQLNAHYQTWLPPIKECHFFDRGFNFSRTDSKCAAFLRKCSKGEKINVHEAHFLLRAIFSKNGRAQRKINEEFLSSRIRSAEKNPMSKLLYHPNDKSINWYKSLFPQLDGLISGDITPAYCLLEPEMIKTIKRKFLDIRIYLQ